MRPIILYTDAPQHCLQVFLTSDPGSIQELCIWKEKTTEKWCGLIIIGVLAYLSGLAHIFRFGYHEFYAALEGTQL